MKSTCVILPPIPKQQHRRMKDAIAIDLTRFELQQMEDARFEIPAEEKGLEVKEKLEAFFQTELGISYEAFEKKVREANPCANPMDQAIGESSDEWVEREALEWK